MTLEDIKEFFENRWAIEMKYEKHYNRYSDSKVDQYSYKNYIEINDILKRNRICIVISDEKYNELLVIAKCKYEDNIEDLFLINEWSKKYHKDVKNIDLTQEYINSIILYLDKKFGYLRDQKLKELGI